MLCIPLARADQCLHAFLWYQTFLRDMNQCLELAQPDEVCRIEITAFPTANRFLAGHRIRVDVSSSNFPRFDVNPNSGAPAGEPSTPVIAVNCVYTGPERPSHIVLSVMPAGERQAAK